MQEADIAWLLRDLFVVTLKLVAPPLLAALVVGLLVSFVQAITQISEPTLAFVPKVLCIGAVLMMSGPFIYATLNDFTRRIFDQLVLIGGQ